MKTKKQRPLPDTMVEEATGEVLRRDVRPFVVSYKGESITVDLPGYYPDGEGDGVHIGDDMRPVGEALRAIKEKLESVPPPTEIRRIRTRLKLTQREAGALLKVGEHAFNKYERGVITPSAPTTLLIKLLDRHPELVKELRAVE
jgi:HTH-type transcriptional regulator/antitoxin MqsA